MTEVPLGQVLSKCKSGKSGPNSSSCQLTLGRLRNQKPKVTAVKSPEPLGFRRERLASQRGVHVTPQEETALHVKPDLMGGTQFRSTNIYPAPACFCAQHFASSLRGHRRATPELDSSHIAERAASSRGS